MGKEGDIFNLTRYSVMRRIKGTTTKVSLKNEYFIIPTETTKHRTGNTIQKFGLTFKGILALLPRVNFEDNYITKNFYQVIKELTDNKFHIVDSAILYAKYHIAVVMSWYKMMGFSLTFQKYPSNLFVEGMTNHILYSNIEFEPNETDWGNFLEIGKRFFVLKQILNSTIIELTKNVKTSLLSNTNIVNLIKNRPQYANMRELKNLLIKYIILDWFMYIAISSKTPINVNDLLVIDYTRGAGDLGLTWLTLEPEMNELARKAAHEVGIKNPSEVNIGTFSIKKSKI